MGVWSLKSHYGNVLWKGQTWGAEQEGAHSGTTFSGHSNKSSVIVILDATWERTVAKEGAGPTYGCLEKKE